MTMLQLNEWTPRNGQTRRYVNNWTEVVGLVVDRYKSGNVGFASLNGEEISNAAAGRILSAKVWVDRDDTVHVDYWCERRVLSAEDVAAKIAAAHAEDLA